MTDVQKTAIATLFTNSPSYIAILLDGQGEPGNSVRVRLKHPTLADAHWITDPNDAYNQIVAAGSDKILLARLTYVPGILAAQYSDDQVEFKQGGFAPVESDIYINNVETNITPVDVFIYS